MEWVESLLWQRFYSYLAPGPVRSLIGWVLGTFFGDRIFAGVLKSSVQCNVVDYHALVAGRNEFARKFHTEIWENRNLDGIIGPVLAMPGLPHG